MEVDSNSSKIQWVARTWCTAGRRKRRERMYVLTGLEARGLAKRVKSTCYSSMRTWIQMPSIHIKTKGSHVCWWPQEKRQGNPRDPLAWQPSWKSKILVRWEEGNKVRVIRGHLYPPPASTPTYPHACMYYMNICAHTKIKTITELPNKLHAGGEENREVEKKLHIWVSRISCGIMQFLGKKEKSEK